MSPDPLFTVALPWGVTDAALIHASSHRTSSIAVGVHLLLTVRDLTLHVDPQHPAAGAEPEGPCAYRVRAPTHLGRLHPGTDLRRATPVRPAAAAATALETFLGTPAGRNAFADTLLALYETGDRRLTSRRAAAVALATTHNLTGPARAAYLHGVETWEGDLCEYLTSIEHAVTP